MELGSGEPGEQGLPAPAPPPALAVGDICTQRLPTWVTAWSCGRENVSKTAQLKEQALRKGDIQGTELRTLCLWIWEAHCRLGSKHPALEGLQEPQT